MNTSNTDTPGDQDAVLIATEKVKDAQMHSQRWIKESMNVWNVRRHFTTWKDLMLMNWKGIAA